ncbi:MAG: branched-chain amino acid transporter AzlC [Erysipelotrichia bacterium]|nr:branched-chain amino acid transporter AzlC [Erysipelotrichia bacterium]
MKKETVKQAFIKTIPVMAGYLVLGIGFGVLLAKIGYGPLYAILMSVTIYAGSMQYVAVSLIDSAASLISVGITTLLVNGRHLFYGLSMLEKYQNIKRKPYLIFGMTDETYSLLCQEESKDEDYYFYITIFNHCYWVIGGLIGNLIGTLIPFNSAGIEFSMTALFVAIVVEQWLTTKNHLPAILGFICAVVCLVIFGPEHFLIPAMLAIMVLLIVVRKGGNENE